MENSKIFFDENSQLRLLDPAKFKHTEDLQQESSQFVAKLLEFRTRINTLAQTLDSQGNDIESEKLKAVGLRNAIESERQSRISRQTALQGLIANKKAQAAKISRELNYLTQIENEQLEKLEKLQNS